MRTRRATVQWRHLVNWREAARCGEWAQHFSNASCYHRSNMLLSPAVSTIQLRRLRQVCRRAGREVTTQLALALVISKLDYCNSFLAGLHAALNIEYVLQKVENIAARLICQLRPRDHVGIYSSLQQLH